MTPKNCTECEYFKTCTNAGYGSTTCKHKDEIIKAAIERDKKNGRN